MAEVVRPHTARRSTGIRGSGAVCSTYGRKPKNEQVTWTAPSATSWWRARPTPTAPRGERCCTRTHVLPDGRPESGLRLPAPLQLDQGLFPRHLRCDATEMPADASGSFATDTPADVCAPQDGDPAYCSPPPTPSGDPGEQGRCLRRGRQRSVTSQNCGVSARQDAAPGPNNPTFRRRAPRVAQHQRLLSGRADRRVGRQLRPSAP